MSAQTPAANTTPASEPQPADNHGITPATHPLLFRLATTLQMPLSFFDLETTTNSPAKPTFGITEFAYLAIMPTGETFSFSSKINPENPVDEAAAKITGINPEELLGFQAFPAHQTRIRRMMERSMLLGFNINTFDIPGLLGQLDRYGLQAPAEYRSCDLREIWTTLRKTQKGKLSEVADAYGKPFDGAHRALADTIACANIFEEMLWRHGLDVFENFRRLNGTPVNGAKASESGDAAKKDRPAPSETLKAELKEAIDALPPGASATDFVTAVRNRGFSIEINRWNKASFSKNGEHFGGAVLGVGYSWTDLAAKFPGPLPADVPNAGQANPQSRSAPAPGPSQSQAATADERKAPANTEAIARAAILKTVESLGVADQAKALELSGLQKSSAISFALSNMLRDGTVSPAAAADPKAQEWLASNSEKVRLAGPLKGILEQAKAAGAPECVDYVQLRCAMALKDATAPKTSTQPAPRQPPATPAVPTAPAPFSGSDEPPPFDEPWVPTEPVCGETAASVPPPFRP